MRAIGFESVKKSYDTDQGPVFDGLDLDISEGEFILLTGKSGSGKSTVLKLILKETEPDGGRITVNGKDISGIGPKDVPEYRRNIGMIFQDFRLFRDYSVYENLEMVYIMTGGRKKEAEKKITDTLTMLGIDHLHKRRPDELSGGETQKICMARALMTNPVILLADEPTGNLDPVSSGEIIKLMELIHRHGTTVVMATHDLDTVSLLENSARRIDLGGL
ncbi:MAG: ATP-binding cassette domain-containing protein [Lachnospiraceae bacterium]|nr:ATP-binding cassette domain-containing protein [Lachnospiraceae bacterium]